MRSFFASLTKRRSIFVLAAVLLVASVPLFYFNFYLSTRGYFEKDVEYRQRLLAGYLELSQVLTETQQQERLMRILDDGVKLHMFDWYLITSQGKPVLFNPPEMAEFSIPEIDGQLYNDEEKTAGTVKLSGDAFITIGINKPWIQYLKKIEKRYYATTIEENALMILLVLGIFAFLLKDILRLLKAVKAGRGAEVLEKTKTHNSLTSEGQLFSEVLQGYQKTVKKLDSEKMMYAGQVLTSLRTELVSGRTPPYEFSCVLVRIDINRYTQMFNAADREVLLKVLHLFFSESTTIVARYGGYMHEFIGDEMIYYMKDEDHPNSVSMALSCLQEIFEATSRFHPEILAAYKLPFTIKASAASGQLRYGPLVNGFSLMGPPLIESVRVLSLIEERDSNLVWVSEEVRALAEDIFEFSSCGRFSLKGYPQEREIFELKSRRELGFVLNEIPPRNVSVLNSYKSPEEITSILSFLTTNPLLVEKEVVQILMQMKNLAPLSSGPRNADLLMSLIRFYRSTQGSATITPTALCLMPVLVGREDYGPKLKEFFLEALQLESERGVANTLEVYGYFEDLNCKELYSRFKDLGSPRTVGNILVIWGKQGVDPELCQIFRERLGSSDERMLASCLYAYTAILQHWQSRDLVYLKAQIEFIELQDQVARISSNNSFRDNISIQRQAQRAQDGLKKIAA